MSKLLEGRVAQQFAPLYLTLVSVMVGLVIADLLGQVHERMVLWPLSFLAIRTWLQIFGNILAVMGAWVTYSHLGMLRHRTPTIWDTIDACLVLIAIPLNANTGLKDPTGWFIFASLYSLLGLVAVWLNITQSAREPGLAHLTRLLRFSGPYNFLYMGVPTFLVAAVLSACGWAPPWLQLLATSLGGIGGVLVTILFMREWRAAVRK